MKLNGFPNSTENNSRLTSVITDAYNCLAHALFNDSRWIWPDTKGKGAWPPDMKREETLECVTEFLMRIGFQPCGDHLLDDGWLKIAIYTSFEIPTHFARQTPSGKWSSKMGDKIDIEHDDLWVLGKASYGNPTHFMKIPTAKTIVIPELHPPAPILVNLQGGALRVT